MTQSEELLTPLRALPTPAARGAGMRTARPRRALLMSVPARNRIIISEFPTAPSTEPGVNQSLRVLWFISTNILSINSVPGAILDVSARVNIDNGQAVIHLSHLHIQVNQFSIPLILQG